MKRLILAGLRGNHRRMLLAAAATLIGAAFVACTLVLGDTLRANVDRQIVGNAAKVTAVAVTDNQLRPLSPDALERVKALPGVESADGMISGDLSVLGADGRPRRDAPVGFSVTMRTNLSGGRAPTNDHEVVLADHTAADLGKQIGQKVAVLDYAGGHPRLFTVVGTVDVKGQGNFALRGAMGFTESAARSVTGETGFAEIDVAGGDATTLVPAMREAIGNGPFQVADGLTFARDQASRSGIDPAVLGTALVMFAIVALLVSAFVIYNTFTILVTQRTRELALARCLGASRGQVFGGVLAESLIIGACASTAGSALGAVVARLSLPIINAFGGGIAAEALTVTPATLLTSFVAGTAATVGAALVPARSATATRPVSALNAGQELAAVGRLGRRRAAVGAVLYALCALFTSGGLLSGHGQSSLVAVALGGILAFLGTVAFGPALVRGLVRSVGKPLRRLLGVSARLAVDNAVRKPRRSATTALALVIGITLTTGVTVITGSLSSSVDAGISQALPADFLVQRPGATTGPAIPREVADRFRTEPDATVTEVRESPVVTADGQSMLSTLEGALTPEVISGSLEGVRTGGVALRPERADELGVRVGDTLTFRVGDEQIGRTVTAIVSGPVVPRMIVSPETFDSLFPGTGDSLILVDFPVEKAPAEARDVVNEATASFPTARIISTYDAHDQLEQTLGQITSFVTGLLVLAIVISLLGISNTMTLSVIERTRETALLRALGLPVSKIRAMLTAEAFMLGIAGGAIGVVLGTVFGAAAAHVINENVSVTVPFATIAALVLGAGVAGVLSSLLPTARASRVSVMAALANE